MSEVAITLEHEFDRPSARWALRVGMLGVLALIAWAAVGRIDQVNRATGQIIATARTQVVQATDAAVLTELHVSEGEQVKAGQLLATFEKARAQAAVDDSRGKVAALRIALARLHAEVYGRPLVFEPELQQYRDFIANQTDLYRKRKTAIDEDIASLQRTYDLARDELRMNEELERTGDVGHAEILRLRRQVADIQAQMTSKRNKYFQDAQADMTKAQEDLNTQTEALNDRSQVLVHTELRAPVAGIVKNLKVTTLGGVVRPGDAVVEILPTGSELIAEVKVSPSDIALVKVGNEAKVKLDAFDFSIYGTLEGRVAYVSPDTLVEDTRQGPQSYYRVHVQIDPRSRRAGAGESIQVRPGMTCTVEIKARERSVLSYLVKPLVKTLDESLGER